LRFPEFQNPPGGRKNDICAGVNDTDHCSINSLSMPDPFRRGVAQTWHGFFSYCRKIPQAKLSAGDDMKIDMTRAGETMKVIVQAHDRREPFLKSLIFSPPNTVASLRAMVTITRM